MNILNKLTIKHLKMNKKRTIVSIIGVILSTALMVGIGLLFSTFREYLIDNTVEYNGDYHVEFSDVSKEKLPIITNNIKVDEYFYSSHIGYAYLENSNNDYKPYLNILGVNDNYLDELELVDGRLPENDKEVLISQHIKSNGGVDYQIGDVLKLDIGERYLLDEEVIDQFFIEGETLKINDSKEYKIVGIVERSKYEDYSEPGYSIFTLDNSSNQSDLAIFIKYKNVNDTYKISEDIAKQLGFENIGEDDYVFYREINYNDSLLAMYGVSKYENMLTGIGGIMAIILGLVSIGCIIVIYNSFAISVMERKKQFGLFSSIGATKHQLRKTVFFEAFIVGAIGITIGLLSGFLGIAIVIEIVNNLIPADVTLKLSAYPLFIIIPILFMIIVIVVSAFLPARRASKITPIEAIRLNDDIKIKSKKIKTNGVIRKLFGIEGDIALKNIKRNKKKYRITIAALFISIVMFITFSSFIDYAFKGVDDFTNNVDYDMTIYLTQDYSLPLETDQALISKITGHEQVDNSVIMSSSVDIHTTSDFSKIMTDEYKEKFASNMEDDYGYISLVVLDAESYHKYLKSLGYKEEKPILLNIQKGIEYTYNTRKAYEIKKYESNDLDINLCHIKDYNTTDIEYDCYSEIKDYYLETKLPFGFVDTVNNSNPIIIVSDEMSKYYPDTNFNTYIKIAAKKYDKLDKMINELDETKNETLQYFNITEDNRLMSNAILAVKILIYGFIVLVTLIGVTSVFNTINTSIALRRKEFAVLRSIGLTPHGFNKILYFESIFFGLKSLLYALPVSFGLVVLVHLSMSNITTFDNIILPIKSILISVVGVFIIVLITMMYASSKIKHENILEAIREENI